MRRALPLTLTVLALGALAGCGSGSTPTITLDASGPAGGTSTPATPRLPKAYQVPSGVPTAADGAPADAVSRRVITKWLSALSAGNIARAARFFAVPSKVQNGTAVFTLHSADDSAIFNASFPCGARATRLQHAKSGFTIVDFVLTERPGGNCGGGGGTARSAIRVTAGHIVEWYRLDQLPVPGPSSPSPSPTPPPSSPSLPGTQIT